MTRISAPARIYFLVARGAPVAVVFRRGPSRQVQLLRWNLETDEVDAGQWLKGRIYERRCDLSPSGRLLVYYAAASTKPHSDKWTWTAVSRPPYLTALAIWFKGDTYCGGGLFSDERTMLLNDCGGPHRREPRVEPMKIDVQALDPSLGEEMLEQSRRLRDGWKLVQEREISPYAERRAGYETRQPRIMERALGRFTLREELRSKRWKHELTFSIPDHREPPDLSKVEHADVDRFRGRLLYSQGGALWAWEPSQGMKMIADLSPHEFQPVEAPVWAKRWP